MRHQENKELYEQISKHPLFIGVEASTFADLMEKCSLKNYTKGEKVLYSKTPREGLLLILSGMAEVFVDGEDAHLPQEVLEVLQKGDMIGFSSLADFLGEPNEHVVNYTVEVRAVEDSDCLHIPYSVVESRWDDEGVRDFILRKISVRLRDIYASLAEQVQLASRWGESEPFIRRVQDLMNEPIQSVKKDATVQEVAKVMVENKTSSVVVVEEDETLVGIITEKDLVARVLANPSGTALHAEAIMTKHPHTITRNAYYYEAMSSFLMNGVKHLPVVENKKAIGMVTYSNLLRKKNRGTMEILQTIEKSSFENLAAVKKAIYSVLAHLINDEIPTHHTLEIITKLYDRLVRHCIDLAIESLQAKGKGLPPVPFSFYQMGSGGRGEQFLLTDQDHFLVYETISKEKVEVDRYFAELGEEIVLHLEKAGYKRCKGEMMASADNWRGSLERWRERMRGWSLRATNENILLGHNFLSYRFLYGNEELDREFKRMVKEQLAKSRIYLYRMAEQERELPVPKFDQPIRALFGMKRDDFDIKKHALFPLHHCLQVLTAHHGIVEGTPMERVEKLVENQVFSRSFAEDLRFAYEIILKLRVNQAWERYQRKDEGTSIIKFAHLRSREKEELTNALKAIRSLQNQTLLTFGLM